SLNFHAVAVAEAPARIAAQRRTASQGWQHEKRNLLAALRSGRRNRAAERQHPRIAKHRYVVQRLVVGLLEAVAIVGIGEVVERDAVKTTAACVTGRGAGIDAYRALRVQV